MTFRVCCYRYRIVSSSSALEFRVQRTQAVAGIKCQRNKNRQCRRRHLHHRRARVPCGRRRSSLPSLALPWSHPGNSGYFRMNKLTNRSEKSMMTRWKTFGTMCRKMICLSDAPREPPQRNRILVFDIRRESAGTGSQLVTMAR